MSYKLKSFDNLVGQGEGKAMVRGVRGLGSAALVSQSHFVAPGVDRDRY